MTSSQGSTNVHSVVHTHDLDDARDVLSQHFLPVRLHTPERRPVIDTRLTGVDLGRVTVGALSFGAQMRIVTDGVSNYHVNVAMTGRAASSPGTTEELVTSPGEAQVYRPGETTDIHWSSNASQLCVMLEREETEKHLAALLGHELREPLVFEPFMNMRSSASRSFADSLRLIDHEMRRESGLLSHELTRRTLERLLIEALLTGQRHNYSDELAAPAPSATPRTVRTAIDLLMAHPEFAWTAGELARQAGVSVRALHAEFRSRMSVGPMAYLRGIRLDRVHDELQLGKPGVMVADVAHRWGFTHMGRFAASYAERFGHLPSRTLHARRVIAVR